MGTGLNLSDHLKYPDMKLTDQLLPYENFKWNVQPGPGASVAMIQLTRFKCGGLAVGALFWHRMMDSASAIHFLKCWAHTSLGSGCKQAVWPNYIASSLFSQCKEAQQLGNNSPDGIVRRGKFIMRRYVFDMDAISALRSKLPDSIIRPSRVETTSALFLRCFMAASLANQKLKTILHLPVNLRRRAHPPLPSDCFGNIVLLLPAFTLCENISNADENNLGELVEKVRASASNFDSVAGDGGFSGLLDRRSLTCGVTSILRELMF